MLAGGVFVTITQLCCCIGESHRTSHGCGLNDAEWSDSCFPFCNFVSKSYPTRVTEVTLGLWVIFLIADRILTICCKQTFCSGVSLKLHPPLFPNGWFSSAPSPWKQQKEKPSGFGHRVSNCGKRGTKLILSVFLSLATFSLPLDILSYLFSLLQFEIPVIAEGN